jgi:hypothetical protein
MYSSKSTFNTTLKKIGRLGTMIVFSLLIIVLILLCVSLDVSWEELRRPTFLEGIFGLTPIYGPKQPINQSLINDFP